MRWRGEGLGVWEEGVVRTIGSGGGGTSEVKEGEVGGDEET